MSTETVYEGEFGTSVRFDGAEGTLFDAWDLHDEYQGGFTTADHALAALLESYQVHQSLVAAYENR